jgi:energy-coupling factor transport system ATP-binding protein
MPAIIKTENLHYTYPGDLLETLSGIDLTIEEGSFVAILGHNGSGKSTLAKLFNAILLPTAGKVWVNGIDTADEAR